MKFSSEAKRQLHPEARLIPISVWEDSFMSYECGYLTKAMISLMQKTDIELQTCINKHQHLIDTDSPKCVS